MNRNKHTAAVFIISILLNILLLFILTSCEKIDPLKNPPKSFDFPDTIVTQKILLEEFTGHQCPNCPSGSETANQLKAVYGNKLVQISIHAGDFADFDMTGDFTYNFQSTTGNELNTFFGLQSYPNGLINRSGFGQLSHVVSPGGWATRIESFVSNIPKIKIKITNVYNSVTRQLSTAINSDILTSLDGTFKISVYITEDSIIKPQKTMNDPKHPDNIIENYVHRHVLRGSMNGVWGDDIFNKSLQKGTTEIKNYSTILNPSWNEKHCSVIAFIYNTSTKEIIQVEEKKLITN